MLTTLHTENGNPVVEFHEVSFGVEPGRPIVSGLSLAVHRSEVLVLLGQSGPGQTELERESPPDEGT